MMEFMELSSQIALSTRCIFLNSRDPAEDAARRLC
jgi:hypothetical protein